MKSLIIYHSSYMGNTERVAHAIARGLNADIITVNQAMSTNLDDYDIIGLGSPINFGSHDKELLTLTATLNLSRHRVFTFSTRCNPILGSYHRALLKIIRRQGGRVVGQFSCRGYDRTGIWTLIGGMNKGRPNDRDLLKAQLFGINLKRKENPLSSTWKKPIKAIKDGVKYRDDNNRLVAGDKIVFLDTTSCIKCARCIKNCPMGIFKVTERPNPTNTNQSNGTTKIVTPQSERNCILCHKCTDQCPADAIHIHETTSTALRIAFSEKRLRRVYLNVDEISIPEEL